MVGTSIGVGALRAGGRIPLTGDADGTATLTGVMTAPEWAPARMPDVVLEDVPGGALDPVAALAAPATAGRPWQSELLKPSVARQAPTK
jgi:hypothetical protein